MSIILTINDLNYQIENNIFFKDFNLTIEKGKITSIIAPNKSGKSMLTKILCAIIPTNNNCKILNIPLTKETVLEYITKIGVVTNDFKTNFLFKKVKDELAYPLLNLAYSEPKINKTITKLSDYFEITPLLNKDINKLSLSLQAKLAIIISLIHNPKVLILDDAFSLMDQSDKTFMLTKLEELNQKGLTILNITSDLSTIYSSNYIYVLNNFQIEKEGDLQTILNQDSYLRRIGLTIPFIIDLSLKLKFYGLITKIYFNLEELENDLWK